MNVGDLLVSMSVDMRQYDADLNTARKKANTFKGIIENALSFTIGMGAFQAVKKGFDSTVKSALDFNVMIQNATTGFTTMLGSAQKAQSFLNEMGRFAASTPFEYPDLLQTSQRMMALGFASQEVLPTLKAIGDATAALGRGPETIDAITYALGQMRMAGRLNAQDMMQLTNAGINAWGYLAEAAGTSVAEVRKMSESGAISGVQAAQIIIAGMEKQFSGMMKKMENSWQGVTSTIKDIWRMTVGALTADMFKGINQWLQGIRDWATEFYNTYQTVSQQFGTEAGIQAALVRGFGAEVAGAIIGIGNMVKWVWNIAVTAAKFIAKYWQIIVPTIMGVASAYMMLRIAITITESLAKVTAIANGEIQASSLLQSIASKTLIAYRAQMQMATAAGMAHVGVLTAMRMGIQSLIASIPLVGWALLAVSAIMTAVIAMWSKSQANAMQKQFNDMMEQMNTQMQQAQQDANLAASGMDSYSNGLNDVADAGNQVKKVMNDNIQSFDEVHQLVDGVVDSTGSLASGLNKIADIAAPKFDFSMPEIDMSAFMPSSMNDAFMNGLNKILGNAKQTISQWLDDVAILIASKGIWDNLQTPKLPPPDVSPVTIAITTVETAIAKLRQTINGWAVDTPPVIQTWATNTYSTISTWAINSYNSVNSFLLNSSNAVNTWVLNTSLSIGTWALNTGLTLNAWAANTYATVQTWTNNTATKVNTWAAEAWDSIKNWAANTGNEFNTWAVNTAANINGWAVTTTVNIKTWATNTAANISAWAINTKANIGTWANNTLTNINTWILTSSSNIYGWAANTSSAFALWANNTSANIAAWARNAGGNIYNWANSAYQNIYNWGDNSLIAINNFLETSADNVNSWANGVIGTIAAWARNAYEQIAGLARAVGGTVSSSIKVATEKLKVGFKAVYEWADENKGWLIPVGAAAGIALTGLATGGLSLPALGLLPALANGGIVTSPTVAMVGESGPEAVVPLDRYNNNEDIAQAVYKAIIDGFRIVGATQNTNTDREIVLKLDSATVARIILPAVIKEGQRQGLNLVVQPQGV